MTMRRLVRSSLMFAAALSAPSCAGPLDTPGTSTGGGQGGSAEGTTVSTGGASTASAAVSTTGGTGGGATTGGADATGGGGAGAGGAPPGVANGYARNPIVSHIFTADPSAHVFEGRVYIYASHDPDDQSGYSMVDYHVFSSDDLVNWQDHGVALAAADTWARYLYAPDCCYSEANGKYYLYFPDSGSGIGVAVSDTPGGPFKEALGKPLISKSTPGVGDVDWLFDPTCFIDDDGQAYLYFGGGPTGTGDNARVIRLGRDMISLADASATTIKAPAFFEASFMHKRDGKYYFSYSTDFTGHAAYIDYMMSDNPMTGFTYAGTILPSPADNNGDNNHHSIVEYQGNWYIFFHNRVLAKRDGFSNYQRSITVDNLMYDAQGKIVQVSATKGRVAQLKSVNARARMEAETMAAQRGIEVDVVQEGGARAGVAVGWINNQDWIGYSQLDFGGGTETFHARVSSGSTAGGSIEVLLGGCEGFTDTPGERIGVCAVGPTGGWQAWTDVECAAPVPPGVHDICLRFTGSGSDPLLNLDYFQFK
ncbi:glycoside hydrolase family 43 protein [Sorangium sp. So ce385]|uniref:glycoside hydrolase family 43 protein n=1 Tax=Sorangium sp. So ce385 TaxID=3133308 RepID=UPI003F5B9C08